MAGYNHHAGMSNNAVAAYSNGIKPLSKITVADLKSAGLTITKTFATWLAKKDHWTPCEWHHSGGTWYNKIDFYDPTELADLIDSKELDVNELQNEFARSVSIVQNGQAVSGTFTIWGGSRKNPKSLGEQQFKGIKKGIWIYIEGVGKKKADGNHIKWSYTSE